MLYNPWENKWILEEPHHACDRQNKRDLYLN